ALGRGTDATDFALGDAPFVLLVIDMPIAADFDLAPFGEEIHYRHTDPVQTAGGLIGPFGEFAAEFEDGHHAFERGNFAVHLLGKLLVFLNRNAAAVVFDRHRAVDVDRNLHFGGIVGHRLVDRVVDDFVDQVVQAAGRGVADVHARPLADVLQIAQVLKVL